MWPSYHDGDQTPLMRNEQVAFLSSNRAIERRWWDRLAHRVVLPVRDSMFKRLFVYLVSIQPHVVGRPHP
ncbi:hypothetical protein EBZ35_04550 [bacterium]|nr:hypothetical protein [bacterium]